MVQLDPQTYALHLNQVLGGNPATTATNGDKVRLNVPTGGAAGTNFTMVMNVVQGDVDKSGSVLAADYSAVKKKFFKNTNSAPAGTDADYSPFHDVDASGSILANDYSEVKKHASSRPCRPAHRPRQRRRCSAPPALQRRCWRKGPPRHPAHGAACRPASGRKPLAGRPLRPVRDPAATRESRGAPGTGGNEPRPPSPKTFFC